MARPKDKHQASQSACQTNIQIDREDRQTDSQREKERHTDREDRQSEKRQDRDRKTNRATKRRTEPQTDRKRAVEYSLAVVIVKLSSLIGCINLDRRQSAPASDKLSQPTRRPQLTAPRSVAAADKRPPRSAGARQLLVAAREKPAAAAAAPPISQPSKATIGSAAQLDPSQIKVRSFGANHLRGSLPEQQRQQQH